MKVSLVSPDFTRKHQANSSPSKYACGFSRTERFRAPNPECKKHFYVKGESKLSKIKFSIGPGKRSDFTKPLACSPSPDNYSHKSLFAKDPRKGKSFANSRETSPDRSYHKMQVWNNPSPNQYEPNKPQHRASSYSMRAKTVDFNGDRLSFKKVPGPGTYEDVNLTPREGRFKISKFGDTKLAKINSNQIRFKNLKISPGPSDYVRKDAFTSVGSYTLSQHKGQGRRPFDRTNRKNFTDIFKQMSSTLPGPGEYNVPSDFGVYGDHKYYKSLNVTID